MKPRSLLALTGAVVAAVVLVASAGAGTSAPAKASPLQSFKLTTRAGALNYLRAKGVDPKTVVVQRGLKNYAGPSCPGKGWNCTTARHVVQFASAAAAADNTFVCDPAGPGTDGPTICVIVQVNTTGDNTANCTETNQDAGSVSLSCSITQQNVSGVNNSNVDQEITQSEFGEISTQTQHGTENASVDQENGTGANHSVLKQTIGQAEVNLNTVINQTQTGDQVASVLQNSASGAQSSTLTQSQAQFAQQGTTSPSRLRPAGASRAFASGSQSQTGNGTATVDQHSTGISTSNNEQDMNQLENVPTGSTVTQTQIGPFRCCSHQDTNPADTFTLEQTKHQSTSGTTKPTQFASLDGELHTTGHGTITQSITQNGDEADKSCTVDNGACARTLVVGVGDGTSPTVRIARPMEGAVYPLGKVVTTEFRCKDKQTGIASCVGNVPNGGLLDTATLGTHAVTVTAKDHAGNTTVVTHHYKVVYTFNGFFAPVTNSETHRLNVAHAGDLLKVSFGLNGFRGLDIFATGFPTSVPVTCPAGWNLHNVPAASAGTTVGLSFQTGPGRGQYNFGWQTTPAYAGTCREFQLELNDGTALTGATFLFF